MSCSNWSHDTLTSVMCEHDGLWLFVDVLNAVPPTPPLGPYAISLRSWNELLFFCLIVCGMWLVWTRMLGVSRGSRIFAIYFRHCSIVVWINLIRGTGLYPRIYHRALATGRLYRIGRRHSMVRNGGFATCGIVIGTKLVHWSRWWICPDNCICRLVFIDNNNQSDSKNLASHSASAAISCSVRHPLSLSSIFGNRWDKVASRVFSGFSRSS